MRFYNGAGLVNEMLELREKNQLSRFLAQPLKQHVIQLDELGFIPFSTLGAQLTPAPHRQVLGWFNSAAPSRSGWR